MLNISDLDLWLKPDCSNCFGLCCIALYFSPSDGFPAEKKAGIPCKNLNDQFQCSIHKKLIASGCRGCAAYECFGAGQQVSQVTYKGIDWRKNPSTVQQMLDVFLRMQRLHELCGYLNEAVSFPLPTDLICELKNVLSIIIALTQRTPQDILDFQMERNFENVNQLLKRSSFQIRTSVAAIKKIKMKTEGKNAKDYFGKDLRKMDLRCANLRGACLIAANLEGNDLTGTDLTGADLRDANLKGADLSASLFLTQFQLNTAKGDRNTKLSQHLARPMLWK